MVEGRNAEFVFFFPLLNRKQKSHPLKLFFIDISKKKEKAQGPFCSVDHLGFPFAIPTPPFHCSVNGTKYIRFLPFFFTFSSSAETKVVVVAQLGEGQQLAPVLQGLC